MSVFTEAELAYLRDQGLGRVATVGPDGEPHVTPVTFHYNEEEDAVDIGGIFFGDTKKWRDAQKNPHVTLLVDDVIGPPRRARPSRSAGSPSCTRPAATGSTRGSRSLPRSSSGSARSGSWPGASTTRRAAQAAASG